MGTPFTLGQLSKLQTVVNIGVATALPNVVAKLDPKSVLKALDGKGEIFASRLETALEQAINSMLVLAPKGVTTITLAERHDPDVFYRTREGFYVYDDYRTRIVKNARPSEVGTTLKVECAELMRDLTDEEIEGALPKSHFFDETQVCAVIAGLIAMQPKGKSGTLINNGYANLFYTGSCVVDVGWNADSRECYVHTWRRVGHRWRAGNQVFSPAN